VDLLYYGEHISPQPTLINGLVESIAHYRETKPGTVALLLFPTKMVIIPIAIYKFIASTWPV
jgi:hypothetical protein